MFQSVFHIYVYTVITKHQVPNTVIHVIKIHVYEITEQIRYLYSHVLLY